MQASARVIDFSGGEEMEVDNRWNNDCLDVRLENDFGSFIGIRTSSSTIIACSSSTRTPSLDR